MCFYQKKNCEYLYGFRTVLFYLGEFLFYFSWFLQGGVWVVADLLMPSCVVYGDRCLLGILVEIQLLLVVVVEPWKQIMIL